MAEGQVGKSILRQDAVSKVTGQAAYPGDFNMDGQLWMKIRFSDRVHARVVSIDTARAEAYPGVVSVFTARDVPRNEYGLVLADQPVMCGPGSTKAGADHVRCLADYVAIVVAETEEAAAAGRDLVDVVYEDLPIVTDAEDAVQDGAPQLHEASPNNVLCHFRIRKGDMAAAWAQAEVTVEGTYTTSWQEHAYLQPEAGLSYIDEQGRVTVVVAGQWVHEDQEQIAHALELPEEEIRVIYPAIGGAFGGREDMSVQIVLALATWKLRRPVKIIWSREESILGHHKRHPVTIHCKWGATRDGKIVAAEGALYGDGGAYAYTTPKVMGNAQLLATGPYVIPNIHLDTYGVYTNNIPCGAFRGFGGPQGLFAAEGQMNKLAELLGIDPVEIRMRNIVHEGDILSVGTPLPLGVTIPAVVEKCAEESGYWEKTDQGWRRKPLEQPTDVTKRRGVGFACGFKNVGFSFGFPEQNWATIELYGAAEIEEVVVRQSGAEVGQGAHTVFVQMAADAAGVEVDRVRLIGSDTAETKTSGSASASRLTFMAGNAIRGAAELALEAWQKEERPAIGTFQYRPPPTEPYDPETGRANPNFAYGYVAQAIEVEVDIETGHVDMIRVVSTNDVGRAVNPLLVQGQIEGAVVQAQGYTIMENLVSVDGKIRNPYLSTYLIPTVLDVPQEVKSVILEYADPIGPWGARGMAEMPFLTVAPAVAAAVNEATGVWIDSIPMTPDRVVSHLLAKNATPEMARFDALILIRGAGALGSGVAYRLVKAGFPVVMTDLANPVMILGTVSYGACVYYHAVIIEGVIARHSTLDQVQEFLAQGIIPVLADPGRDTLTALKPTAVVDARDEYVNGDTTIHDAPLVIGVGPGFAAGIDCHAVIETQRGHDLGRVRWRGRANPQIADDTVIVRSPVTGITSQIAAIGEIVGAGKAIMRVGETQIHAPIEGVLRGLIDIDLNVKIGDKLALIDPHARREDCFTISARSLAIGGGVVESVLSAPEFAKDLVLANRVSQGSNGGGA